MADCPHCDGTGVCQDDYHDNAANEIASDFVLGADCPSGCDGSSISAGYCPHCDGSGSED
jgi:hypothetical protein